MKINCAKGTPDQMLEQFKNRIGELEGIGIDSSFDYPDDLEDLENGEYESHVTEPINSSVSYDDLDGEDVVGEVLDFFKNKMGLDTDNREVKNYAEAVAEYIDMSRQAYAHEGRKSPYTMEDWYNDTKMNYPDELEGLPTIDSCDNTYTDE